MRLQREITSAFFVICCGVAQPAAPHQCTFEDNWADAIQLYNICKADLVNGTANQEVAYHDAGLQSKEMAILQAEIVALKKQLKNIKRHLLAILGDL